MKNFDGLGLHPVIAKSLKKMNYGTPTPIQAKAIPLALDGRDIMGSAQTGTGKTAAFSIPVVEALLANPNNHALILTPTRELGKQVLGIVHDLLGPNSDINTAFLIGGDSMQKQNNQLRRKPRLVVGTPGRINDHLERGNLKLHQTNFLVLDETDRMLDMGFSVQLDRILKHLPRQRQTLMFSATLPSNIMSMAKKYLDNPERISVGSTITPAKNIKQEVIRVADNEKYEQLMRTLETRAGTIVMFVKTKYGTERMAKRLKSAGYEADALHGDLKQSRRDRVLTNFRDMKFQILVATDVAARGLDIPHIQHVINYDLPQVPEDFIHRIGRTARAGANGEAISFVSPQDGRKWHAIEILMDPTMKGSSLPNKNAAKRRGKPSGKKSYGKKSFGKSSDRRDDKPFKKSKKFAGKPTGKSNNKPYGKKRFEDNNEESSENAGKFKKKNPFKRGQKNVDRSEERSDRSEGKKKKAYSGNFKSKSKRNSSDERKDGNGFAKKKRGGFKGNGNSPHKGPKGGNKFRGGPNKARPASGGGKRPKSRAA